MWRIILLPALSLLALLPLVPLPAAPAAVIAMSRFSPVSGLSKSEPLLSRILTRELLSHFSDTPEDVTRVNRAHLASSLSSLNASSSPLLTLCPAPECADVDLLVLTLLHKRATSSLLYDPHHGVVEQWSRPAAHYLHPSRTATPAGAFAMAARDGLRPAFHVLAEEMRIALHPQLLSDPDDWRLLWRQALPGPAGLLAGSADGRHLAVSYRRMEGEAVSVFIRHFSSRPLHAAASHRPPEDVVTYEDIELAGNMPVTAVSLAGDHCIVYARRHDSRLFRAVCRSPRRRAWPSSSVRDGGTDPPGTSRGATVRRQPRARWRPTAPGPLVDRRQGYAETALLCALPGASASRHRPIESVGLLLVAQLASSGHGESQQQDVGMSLRLLSPPRRRKTRVCAPTSGPLKLLPLPRCKQQQWSLRAATASQPSPERSAAMASSDAQNARSARPLLASSAQAEHTAVAFARTITTVHTRYTHMPATPAAGGSGRRSSRRKGGGAWRHLLGGRRHARVASRLDSSMGAVMLELQVDGIGSSGFHIMGHERSGSRLSLLISPREVLLLSRVTRDDDEATGGMLSEQLDGGSGARVSPESDACPAKGGLPEEVTGHAAADEHIGTPGGGASMPGPGRTHRQKTTPAPDPRESADSINHSSAAAGTEADGGGAIAAGLEQEFRETMARVRRRIRAAEAGDAPLALDAELHAEVLEALASMRERAGATAWPSMPGDGTVERAEIELAAWRELLGGSETELSRADDPFSDDASQSTWRLETATLPRVRGLHPNTEPLAMLLLPTPTTQPAVLVLYEGGAVASYNLTSALQASAEYAAGGLSPSGTLSSLSIALMAVAVVGLVLGMTMLFVGMRLGMHGILPAWPLAVLCRALRNATEYVSSTLIALGTSAVRAVERGIGATEGPGDTQAVPLDAAEATEQQTTAGPAAPSPSLALDGGAAAP
jgi:hypothetical protein